MPFPNLAYCIVCEGMRPEVGGKLTILGFYGLAPNVDVRLVDPNLPLGLSLVVGFPPINEIRPYAGIVTVTKPNGAIAYQTPPAAIQVVAGRGGVWGVGCVFPPPHVPGRYTIRFLVNNELKLETSMLVGMSNPAELAAMGIPMPPGGRPN